MSDSKFSTSGDNLSSFPYGGWLTTLLDIFFGA